MALDKTGLTRFWQHIVARLGTKVDKVEGKGLSTNDFTTEEKNKLAAIENEATKTIVDSTLSLSSSTAKLLSVVLVHSNHKYYR